jgi:hypothetical protein
VLKGELKYSSAFVRGDDDEFCVCPLMQSTDNDSGDVAFSVGYVYVRPGCEAALHDTNATEGMVSW